MALAIARAMQRYGLYVADNGEDFYVQGEPSPHWNLETFSQLKAITMEQMEFVDLSKVTSDPRWSNSSMAARW